MADFELRNLDDVLSRLEKWGGAVIEAIDDAVVETGAEGAAAVAAAAPVLTGRLKASVRHTHHGWATVTIEVGEDVPYTRAVEARLKFFNRAIAPAQAGLTDKIVDKVKAAF